MLHHLAATVANRSPARRPNPSCRITFGRQKSPEPIPFAGEYGGLVRSIVPFKHVPALIARRDDMLDGGFDPAIALADKPAVRLATSTVLDVDLCPRNRSDHIPKSTDILTGANWIVSIKNDS